MPYSKEHKQKTRQRILDSASRLFPRKGYDAVSIDDLMEDAGLTRGAFYHHFGDKADVYSKAVFNAAFRSPIANYEPTNDSASWLSDVIDGYLNSRHIEDADIPCPLAFLATDIGNRQTHARKAYGRVYGGLVDAISSRMEGFREEEKNDVAMAVTALMIGGVAISRALESAETTEKLLGSCRQVAKQLLRATEEQGALSRAGIPGQSAGNLKAGW